MKIYSWNMLYRNRETRDAFRFIAKSDFDIFCLQEVPEEVLARLKTLPFYTASRTDAEKTFPSRIVPMYNVILSRYPIEKQGEVSFDDYWTLLPLRARIFTYLMRPFHFAPIHNRGGIFADITIEGRSVRVFNLHLILAQPTWRLKEFETAMMQRDPSKPSIVCGDFNTLQQPHITPLNWLLGGSLRDALLYNRERTTIEKHFVAYELQNPLHGGITHPFSQSQLDHILVSHSFSIQKAEVLPDRIGSDHHPIFVEIS